MAITSGITLYIMSKTLFLIIVVLTVLNAILVFFFKKVYKDVNFASMDQSARINLDIIEKIKAIETIKAHTYENNVLDKLESEYKKAYVFNSIKYKWWNWVVRKHLTIGTFMSFLTLSSLFMEPTGRLIGAQFSIQETNIAMKRISEILDIPKRKTLFAPVI